MEVNVTKEHIRAGAQGSCAHCPIAHALDAAFGLSAPPAKIGTIVLATNGYTFWLDLHMMRGADLPKTTVLKRYTSLNWSLPATCLRFVDRFDRGGPDYVRPFTFELDERIVYDVREKIVGLKAAAKG